MPPPTSGKQQAHHKLSHLCKGSCEAQQTSNQAPLYEGSHSHRDTLQAQSEVSISSMSPAAAQGYLICTEVNGVQIELLVDTGSAVSILSLNMWNRCIHRDLEPWTGQRLVGVDGTPLQVEGCGKIKLKFGQTVFDHHIDSLTSEGILGLDFLQRHKCVVNLEEGILQFL